MTCKIVLEYPGAISPGNSIAGHVICRLDVPANVGAINCTLRGQEITRLFIDGNEYLGNRVFLKEEKMLGGTSRLESGIHKFPFNIKLPKDGIPSSYEHALGKIWYYLTAKVPLNNATESKVHECEVTVGVSASIDFNKMIEQIHLAPVSYEMDETVETCFCYGSNTVTMEMELEKDAFLVGDIIKIKLHINNSSNSYSNQTTITLSSYTEFIATHPIRKSHKESKILAEVIDEGTKSESRRTYYFNITVPHHKVHCFTNCSLFKQKYILLASATFSGFKLELPMRIHIGHIDIDRPINLGELTEETTLRIPTINIVPVAQAPIDIYPPENRCPYPVGDSAFPMMPSFPNRPGVQSTTAHSEPDLLMSLVSPINSSTPVNQNQLRPFRISSNHSERTNRLRRNIGISVAPLAEIEELLQSLENITHEEELPTPPPTYNDAIRLAQNNRR